MYLCNLNVISFLFCTIISGATSIILGKDVSWDLLNYHFYNGYALLTNRLGYDIAPAQIQTYLNPLLDVFIYLGVAYANPKVHGFLLGAIQGIGIWFVFLLTMNMIALRYSTKVSIALASLAAATAFGGSGWFSELGTAFGDNMVSILVLAALVIVTRSVPHGFQEVTTGRFASAGLLFGIAAGLKLLMALYFIGFIASLALIVSTRHLLRIYFLTVSAFCVGILLSSGFWMVKLYEKFDSPLFPFYNMIFKSPYYVNSNISPDRFLPKTLLENICYPFYFTADPLRVCEVQFRDYRLVTFYILIAIITVTMMCWLITNKVMTKTVFEKNKYFFFVCIFCIVSYLLWQNMFSVYRYAIVIEQLIPVLIITSVQLWSVRRVGIALSVLGLVLLIVTVKPIKWRRLPWGTSYFSVMGVSTQKFADSTIIMAGGNPTAFIIPFFPASTRFVRIRSNLYNPSQNTMLREDIANAIRQARSLKILLTSQKDRELDSAKAIGVVVECKSSDTISVSNGDTFTICDASLAQ